MHNVLVEVDSGGYTVIFAGISAASFASSSRALKSSGVQRSRTWPNGLSGLPPGVDPKVQSETLGIHHTASVLDRAFLAGTPFALLGRVHFPSGNIDEDVAFWSQPDIMDLNGKKGIYSGAIYLCELAERVGCTPGRFITNSRALSRRLYLGEPCWRPSGVNNFYSSALAGAVFDILTGLGALRTGVSAPLTGRSSPCLPSSASSMEVERQAPLRVPGHRAAVVGESTKRQGRVDPNTSVPVIAPISGYVEGARRLERCDVCVGRGSRERGLEKGLFCNHYTVRQYGRDRCIDLFGEHLAGNRGLQDRLLELSGRRLLCRCKAHGRCHADELIRQFLLKYPEAYAMGLSVDAPLQEVALAMAWARQEDDDGEVSATSSEDEPLFPTRLGRCPRTTVGSGPSFRDVRDGCGRCSPGMWLSWRGTWKEGWQEEGIFEGRRRRTASRLRWIGLHFRHSPAWLVNPSATRWDLSPQEYGLAWGFVYLVCAGSKGGRTSREGRSSPWNWFPGRLPVCTGIVGRHPMGCSDRARVGFYSEWVPERSVDGVWSSSTVWFSWSFLQESAR